jgi:hypothetical protein
VISLPLNAAANPRNIATIETITAGLGVGVTVAGKGVGDDAAAVWVCIMEASWIANVPAVSTGSAVASGVHAITHSIVARPITARLLKYKFI